MSHTETQRYTVTAALIYANGPIHIGHLAGCYLPADIYVRYLRATGKDVLFVSGTDEHGVPITIKAKKENSTPQEVVDKYYKQIKKSFEEFGISFDIYSRTSSTDHHEVSSDFFKKLYDKNVFVEETTEQYYDELANQFLADRYIMGTCPHCSNENAYGDQCEKCGTSLNPTDLINPRSTLSGNKPVFKSTKNWYLPLDKMQPQIESFIEEHKEWKSNVLGQCKSWLKQGLHPRAMTRDLEWGVKVPLPNTDGKVLYVWFDAPLGYITFTKQLCAERGIDWEPYWKAKDTKLVHFIGKDNIVFHCIIFPAMLMAEGSYILPDNVPANEFMNLEGDKISTSRNWAIWLHEYLEEFPAKQDVLRYALCVNAPENKDNDFTWKELQLRNNGELVAVLGNFINRALVLTHKYYNGKTPSAGLYSDPLYADILTRIEGFKNNISQSIENYRFREALAELMDLARLGNKFLADVEPWKKKDQPEVMAWAMYIALQISAALAKLMEPFMPFSAAKLAKMLNISLDTIAWNTLNGFDLIPEGHILGEASLLFEKIEDDVIQKQIEKLEATKIAQTKIESTLKPIKEAIAFDDFGKMDIRIATVLEAEKVPKTSKLLKLTLDTGIDKRIVVSGIAEHYSPEELVGKQVCLLANLAPRKIKGIDSEGMILMAEDKEGKLHLLAPSTIVNSGSIVG